MEHMQINQLLEKTLLSSSAKQKCQNIVQWSWEMLGTFLIMFGSMNEIKSAFCLRKQSSEEQSSKEFTLVLDLDETLIHSDSSRSSDSDEEIIVKIGNTIEKYYIKLRPYVREFLAKMGELFELVIFTAAMKEYADKVIDFLDPEGLIKRRFYRDSCTKKDGTFYKDITKVREDVDKVCIIDNSVSGLCLNYSNGLLIKSWYNDPKDKELKTYGNFFEKHHQRNKDMRKVVDHLKKRYPKNILN